MPDIHKRVTFRGDVYWRHEDLLSPLDHYDDAGDLLADAFVDVSYALIIGPEIHRHGQVIGRTSELQDVIDQP
jgi:hypothetical protein